MIDAPLRLQGAPRLGTTIGSVLHPHAVLCRSNSGAIAEVFSLLEERRRVAMVGGGVALERLAVAAGELKEGRRTGHPELFLFTSWEELREYATVDPSGGDLMPLIEIIDAYGAEVVLAAVRNLSSEVDAEVVVSTAHRAKGREWPTVRISEDFALRPGRALEVRPNGLPDVNLDDARLAYVAVTRARERLDLGGLSWIVPYFDHASASAGARSVEAPSAWDSLGPVPG